MKINVGDLVYVPAYQSNGIVIEEIIVKETQTINDMWKTRMLVREVVYKVLLDGKVVKLIKQSIKKV